MKIGTFALEGEAGRAALVAGTLAGEAALGFRALGRGEAGAVEQGCGGRWDERSEDVGGSSAGGQWVTGAGGTNGRRGLAGGCHARAVVGAVTAAAGGEMRAAGVLCQCQRGRCDREAEGGEQEHGEEATHCDECSRTTAEGVTCYPRGHE